MTTSTADEGVWKERVAEAQRAAYADVVEQGLKIYNNEQNDIGDRRAIRQFIDRFIPKAYVGL